MECMYLPLAPTFQLIYFATNHYPSDEFFAFLAQQRTLRDFKFLIFAPRESRQWNMSELASRERRVMPPVTYMASSELDMTGVFFPNLFGLCLESPIDLGSGDWLIGRSAPLLRTLSLPGEKCQLDGAILGKAFPNLPFLALHVADPTDP